jgi:hypothetical protein
MESHDSSPPEGPHFNVSTGFPGAQRNGVKLANVSQEYWLTHPEADRENRL